MSWSCLWDEGEHTVQFLGIALAIEEDRFHLAWNPGSHPAFRCLQDEKLDESLGSRLDSITLIACTEVYLAWPPSLKYRGRYRLVT